MAEVGFEGVGLIAQGASGGLGAGEEEADEGIQSPDMRVTEFVTLYVGESDSFKDLLEVHRRAVGGSRATWRTFGPFLVDVAGDGLPFLLSAHDRSEPEEGDMVSRGESFLGQLADPSLVQAMKSLADGDEFYRAGRLLDVFSPSDCPPDV